jgi:hypothetical protein
MYTNQQAEEGRVMFDVVFHESSAVQCTKRVGVVGIEVDQVQEAK